MTYLLFLDELRVQICGLLFDNFLVELCGVDLSRVFRIEFNLNVVNVLFDFTRSSVLHFIDNNNGWWLEFKSHSIWLSLH